MDKKTSAQTLIIAVLKKKSVVWYIIPSIVSYQKVVLVIWKLRRKKSRGSSIRCFFLLFSYSRRYLSFLINKPRPLMPVWVNQEVDDLDYPSDRNRHWLLKRNKILEKIREIKTLNNEHSCSKQTGISKFREINFTVMRWYAFTKYSVKLDDL